MPEIHRNPEISDTEKTEVSAFKEIKPETDMTVSDAKSFVDSLFKETQDTSDGYYNSYETRSSNIPVDGVRGKWEGERGESGTSGLTFQYRFPVFFVLLSYSPPHFSDGYFGY